MVSCELCGKPATTKARIEGVVFSVCAGCASLGNELREAPRSVTPRAVYSSLPTKQSFGSERLLAVDFGSRLRSARQKKGLNEKDAARQLNIKESMLLHFEAGKMQPDDALAKKLERFYGISIYESLE